MLLTKQPICMKKLFLLFITLFIAIQSFTQNKIDEINILIIHNKYSEALALSDEIYAEYATNADFFYQRAILLKLLYNYRQAINAINKAIDLNPENTEYLTELGFILFRAEKIYEAQRIFEQVIQVDPYNFKCGIALSNLYMNDKKIENAEKVLLKLYEKDSLNAYITRNIGICKYLQGDTLTFNWLKKANELDSTDIKTYRYLFTAYTVKEDFDKAFGIINRAQSIDPQNELLYVMEADLHVIRNHNFRAIPVYLKAYEIDPEDEELPRKIGLCYYKVKNYELAKHYLRLADQESMNLDVYKHLGYIYKMNNVPDSSNYYFNKALELLRADNNTIFDIYIDVAENYYALGKYQHAIGWYERALNLEITGIWWMSLKNKALIDIASVYADKLNDKEKAIEYFNKVKDDSSFFVNEQDYYKYAQQQITKLKEDLFFEGKL